VINRTIAIFQVRMIENDFIHPYILYMYMYVKEIFVTLREEHGKDHHRHDTVKRVTGKIQRNPCDI